MDPIALANLLAILVPLGAKVYIAIQQANQDQLKPLADVIAAADANWDDVIVNAQAEIAKFTPTGSGTPGATVVAG